MRSLGNKEGMADCREEGLMGRVGRQRDGREVVAESKFADIKLD